MKLDAQLGRLRLGTEAEGFFQHGYWQKRTADCSRSQSRRAHCCDADTKYPKYRDVLASAQAGDQVWFMWDPHTYWARDVNGERVLDERCGPCRRRENARSGR